jgi:hypothetical protein
MLKRYTVKKVDTQTKKLSEERELNALVLKRKEKEGACGLFNHPAVPFE